MKAKTIKKALRAKIDEWLSSIEDEALRKQLGEQTIVTGGAIASMLLQESVNDYDIYFRTMDAAVAAAKYYVNKFPGYTMHGINVKSDDGRVRIVTAKGYRGETAGDVRTLQDSGEIEESYQEAEAAALKVDDKPKYRPIFLSTNAITLANKMQIILRFWGEPDAIHKNYDFVHCTNYWTSWDGNLVLRPAALETLLSRELRYAGSKYPVCSVFRLRKFIKRGWSINAGQILKMLMQISALDLTDPLVLEDQLTGVDSAYFIEIMQKLNEKDPEKVNTAYLVEIIDRMF